MKMGTQIIGKFLFSWEDEVRFAPSSPSFSVNAENLESGRSRIATLRTACASEISVRSQVHCTSGPPMNFSPCSRLFLSTQSTVVHKTPNARYFSRLTREEANDDLSSVRKGKRLRIQHCTQREDDGRNAQEHVSDTCGDVDFDVAALDRSLDRRESARRAFGRKNLLVRLQGGRPRHRVYEPNVSRAWTAKAAGTSRASCCTRRSKMKMRRPSSVVRRVRSPAFSNLCVAR